MALLNGEVKVDAREFFAESMDVEGALNFANALQLFFRPIGAAVTDWACGSCDGKIRVDVWKPS